MSASNPHVLTQPVYIRLPADVSEQIRHMAMEQERTISLQIRWLLQKALRLENQDQLQEQQK